jgi:hypothetical protein
MIAVSLLLAFVAVMSTAALALTVWAEGGF